MARRVGGDGDNGVITFKRKNVISFSYFLFLQKIICVLSKHILETHRDAATALPLPGWRATNDLT